jgi:hypothetical protein
LEGTLGPWSAPQVAPLSVAGGAAGAHWSLAGTHTVAEAPAAVTTDEQSSPDAHDDWAAEHPLAQKRSPANCAHANPGRQSEAISQGSQGPATPPVASALAPASAAPPR